MWLSCKDFVKAGVVHHAECCPTCHDTANLVYKPLVPERYRGIAFHCCCGLSHLRFTAEEMELVLQHVPEGRD